MVLTVEMSHWMVDIAVDIGGSAMTVLERLALVWSAKLAGIDSPDTAVGFPKVVVVVSQVVAGNSLVVPDTAYWGSWLVGPVDTPGLPCWGWDSFPVEMVGWVCSCQWLGFPQLLLLSWCLLSSFALPRHHHVP